MMSAVDSGAPPARRRSTRHQRSWYWYDWANSAYVTTTATVLMTRTSRPSPGPPAPACRTARNAGRTSHVLGIPVAPGSLVSYTVTVTTILSAMVLIVIGAIADRVPAPTRLFAGFAWAGALAASLMFFVAGTNWQLGAVALVVAGICLGASLVIYDSILCRDRQRGRARPGLLEGLGVRLPRRRHPARAQLRPGLLPRGPRARPGPVDPHQHPVRGSLVGRLHDHPYLGLRHLTGTVETPVERSAGRRPRQHRASCGSTFRDLANYPQTKLFLVAYLFFNDGIQTVIGSSSVYGSKELGFSETTVLGVFLFVQFVAFVGARLFGRVAASIGAWRTVLYGIGLWTVVVVFAFLLPSKSLVIFLALALLIGLVLGGTPGPVPVAVQPAHPPRPRGGVLQPLPGHGARHELVRHAHLRPRLPVHLSYRWAIIALIVFFAIGGVLLVAGPDA